jgi:alkanesulfonate monooxygenase SsuD/methylene tetrahydromethanopterin reductase-like flavin-dependent oxidoreductase (luciferase family)
VLRIVAQYADASNILGSPAALRHKLEVLDRHCEDLGRDPAELRRTHTCMAVIAPTSAEAERRVDAARAGLDEEMRRGGHYLAGDPGTVAEQASALFELGLDEVMLFTDRMWTDEDIALLGEVLTALDAVSTD